MGAIADRMIETVEGDRIVIQEVEMGLQFAEVVVPVSPDVHFDGKEVDRLVDFFGVGFRDLGPQLTDRLLEWLSVLGLPDSAKIVEELDFLLNGDDEWRKGDDVGESASVEVPASLPVSDCTPSSQCNWKGEILGVPQVPLYLKKGTSDVPQLRVTFERGDS
jgi:hypothetical protein